MRWRTACVTSNARLEYQRGRVGRGFQPPSSPQPNPNLHTNKHLLASFRLDHHGPTDWRMDRRDGTTDKATFRVASPRLRMSLFAI